MIQNCNPLSTKPPSIFRPILPHLTLSYFYDNSTTLLKVTQAPPTPKAKRFRLNCLLLALYLIARATSSVARLIRPQPDSPLRFNEKIAQVHAVNNDLSSERLIKMAYLDYVPPNAPNAPVIVMLHSSPGSGAGKIPSPAPV